MATKPAGGGSAKLKWTISIVALLAAAFAAALLFTPGVEQEGGGEIRPGGPEAEDGKEGGDSEEGGPGAIGVLAIPRAAPVLGLTQGPGPINLGERPFGAESLRKTVRVRRTAGRADPITMDAFNVRLAEGSAGDTTLPVVIYGTGECGSGSYEVDTEGTYCHVTIEWTPRDGEILDAVVAAKVEVWESERALREAETIADRPGGWEPFVWEWKITGRSEAAPPPARLAITPERVEWTIEPGERGESVVKIGVEHRPVFVVDIRPDPPDGGISVVAGREGECKGELEKGRECPVRVRYAPGGQVLEETVEEGEIVVAWRELQRDGEKGRLQTSTASYKATSLPIEITPEATLAIDPETLRWEGVLPGEQTKVIEIVLEVTEAPAEIISIGTNAAGDRADLEMIGADKCTRTYTPGRSTGRDWCGMRVRIRQGKEVEDDARMVVIWGHGIGGDPGDRIETLVPIQVGLTQPEADDPAKLDATPEKVDFGPVNVAGDQFVRITLTNTGGANSAALIESMSVLDGAKRPLPNVQVQPGQCTEGTLSAGEFCDARVVWNPQRAGPMEGVLEVIWRKDGVRARYEVMIEGQYMPPQVDAPTRPAGPMVPSARNEFKLRRSLAALGDGYIDLGGEKRKAEERARTRPLHRRIVDKDFAAAGEDWLESGRPVDLLPVVLSNTPIPAVLTNRCNAIYDCVMRAMVERDVWGGGPARAVVIPRGVPDRRLRPGGRGSGRRRDGRTNQRHGRTCGREVDADRAQRRHGVRDQCGRGCGGRAEAVGHRQRDGGLRAPGGRGPLRAGAVHREGGTGEPAGAGDPGRAGEEVRKGGVGRAGRKRGGDPARAHEEGAGGGGDPEQLPGGRRRDGGVPGPHPEHRGPCGHPDAALPAAHPEAHAHHCGGTARKRGRYARRSGGGADAAQHAGPADVRRTPGDHRAGRGS